MKRFLQLLLTVACTLGAFGVRAERGQLDIAHLKTLAEQVTPEKYPDADAVWMDGITQVRYEPDGTYVYWEDECFKVLTEKGRRENMTSSYSYVSTYTALAILKVEIIKSDGRIISIDLEKNVNTTTDNSSMSANIYDPAHRKTVVQHPGLETGDMVRTILVRNTTKPRVPNTFADISVFEYTLPILHSVYEVSAPADRPLIQKRLRSEVPGTVTYTETVDEEGRTLHRWEVKNVDQVYPEPDMPTLYTQVQRLIVSTAASWKDISSWYWKLCEPRMTVTPAIKEKTAELIKGCTTREEKIQTLFKFVSQEIRYMGIIAESEAPGYEPHDIALTFDNRYGVCRDKAALLAAMLREAGIEGFPVLIHAGAKMDQDVPLPYFNHAITAALDDEGNYILMDPTDEQTRELFPAYLCNKSYLVARPEGDTLRTSEVYPASRNMATLTTTGELLADNTLVLSCEMQLDGLNDNIYRSALLTRPLPERRRLLEGIVKGRFPGAEMTAFSYSPKNLQDTSQPLVITLGLRVPGYCVKNESGLAVFPMPWLSQTIGATNFLLGNLALEKRRYTLELPSTAGLQETLSIRGIGALGAAEYLPAPFQIDHSGLRYTRTVETTENGSVLEGKRFFALTNQDYSPEDYLLLRKSRGDIGFDLRRDPRFAAGPAKDADVEVIQREMEITLLSADSWKVNTLERNRILTYAGKKNASELTFTHNPAWETFTVINASVTGTDGTEKQVEAREINVMDAEWVASAPRYPAGKITVVSLPGVETGSITAWETETVVTNAPFFALDYAFGGFDPVAAERLKINVPLALADSFHYQPGLLDADGGAKVSSVVYTNSVTAFVSYTWSSDPRPATRREEALPPAWCYRPSVIASSGNWKSYMATLREQLNPVRKANKNAIRQARSLTKSCKTPEEKILTIRNELARNVRQAGTSFLALPFLTASAPDTTLADGYGNSLDRVLLLEAMLNGAGIEAEIIFATGHKAAYAFLNDRNFTIPQPWRFNAPLVRATLGEKTYYLDATDQYAPLGTTSRDTCAYFTLNGKTGHIEIAPELGDRSEDQVILVLEANGDASISRQNWYYGTAAGPFRKSYTEMTPENRKRHAQDLVTAIDPAAVPASLLVTDTRDYPGLRMYSAFVPRYGVRDGQTLTFKLPENSMSLLRLRSNQRTEDIYLSSNGTFRKEWDVYLPAGVKRVVMKPEAFIWNLPENAGTVTFTCTENRDFKTGITYLTFTRSLELNPAILGKELYPALLEMNRRLSEPALSLIVAEF